MRGGRDLGRVSGEPRGGEAALTLSCSSRLKLRASWSWTSSSGPQDGGWGRDSVRGWGRQEGPRGGERDVHTQGWRQRARLGQSKRHTNTLPELVKNSKEISLGCGWEPGWAGPGRPSTQRGKGAGKDGAEGGGQRASRGERPGEEGRAGADGEAWRWMAERKSTPPCPAPPRPGRTWSASSLLMARASWSCSSSSPLLCGQACSASGGGPEPTAAEEAEGTQTLRPRRKRGPHGPGSQAGRV